MDEYLLQALIDRYFWDMVFVQLVMGGTLFYIGYYVGKKTND